MREAALRIVPDGGSGGGGVTRAGMRVAERRTESVVNHAVHGDVGDQVSARSAADEPTFPNVESNVPDMEEAPPST